MCIPQQCANAKLRRHARLFICSQKRLAVLIHLAGQRVRVLLLFVPCQLYPLRVAVRPQQHVAASQP